MEPVCITTRADYDLYRMHGYEPLIDRHFMVAIRLRVAIQRELFGTGHTPEENEKFYRWCWDHYPHICQETISFVLKCTTNGKTGTVKVCGYMQLTN